MKIRTGFVSNSSSSSFIIHWECYIHENGTPLPIEKILMILFEYDEYYGPIVPYEAPRIFGDIFGKPNIEEEKSPIINEPTNIYNEMDGKMLGELIASTKEIRPGYFETIFNTSMRNTPLDYGMLMHKMMAALAVENASNGNARFKVVMMKVEGD